MMIDAQLRWLFRRRRVREAVSRGCQASRLLAAFVVNLLYIPSPEPESRLAVRGRWEQGIDGRPMVGIIIAYKPTRQGGSAGLPIRHILSSLGMHCARFDPWSLWLAWHRCSGTTICRNHTFWLLAAADATASTAVW
jgi:hypothetical protein